MQSINVSFPSADEQSLSGILDRPLGEPVAYALFAHCFTCSKNLKAAANISRSMTAAGIAVLRFDFTGLGQSEGAFEDTSFSSNVADLLAASAWLEQEHRAPDILFGHSLGGTAILQAAGEIPSAVAVATIGSPADPAHVAHLLAGSEDDLLERGEAEVQLGGRPFRMKRQFLDDLTKHDLPAAVGRLRKALLVMHAPLDDIVEVDNASRLFAAAKHPKSFVSLDRADHLLSHEDDSSYAGHVLAAWATRYLPASEDEDPLSAEPGEVYARTTIDSFATDVRAGHHSFVADEPLAVGGTDTGPTPYDLLAAALATCTSMTLKMYARHKKLDLRSATVRVTHGRIHAEDCEDCSRHEGMIHQFRRELRLVGDLDDEQRQRMLEIADRCPVHKTLHDEIKIRSQLAR
ncbi:MAG: bifunctional alpha/beta hydrolase/OsmC family protein [Gammaproteobacteria bacterium]|nr:bifunctional alpha/beta hydrolase/OsmC family protein [Gammaproteobacteria bacterium]